MMKIKNKEWLVWNKDQTQLAQNPPSDGGKC